MTANESGNSQSPAEPEPSRDLRLVGMLSSETIRKIPAFQWSLLIPAGRTDPFL